ncbi:MAG: DEAD/DEAH box helicase family protein [Acidobacteria bacterium]|nr:DEAD/DEAH box helicase family protein [Acidobacteriota bacterium]
MNRHINAISGRLSLRPPQRQSLEILSHITEILPLEKGADSAESLRLINAEYPTVTDFERDFPSLCFALATGVGKTRLMGAFIAYLHLAKGIRHFFVLAPNLTIYNKLIADFTPNHPKYVLQGIAEFAQEPPEIITGDNYESGRGVRERDLFGERGIHINVFNISKINSETRGGREPRIKRLSEYIGQSYFDYLAELNDLVLLMDESHRYRASAGVRAINELKPILGLELTATPQIEAGSKPLAFKNVIYSYALSQALSDGFVKEPAVATRENFDPKNYTAEQLEELKIADGVRIHESTKVELETFAKQHDLLIVKPFMLIVARDTEHANALMTQIKSADFFAGHYKERVITVHSNQRGEEADETVARLLAVEKTDEPTEIVIHVNMLKEGWDVTNLYTIVPLRAANSRTLVEQSIGRGLRLPYGRRVGVSAVDRLTIVAHDKFQEIVDEANKPDSVIRLVPVYIGRDVAQEQKKSVTVEPTIIAALTSQLKATELQSAPPAQSLDGVEVMPQGQSKVPQLVQQPMRFDNLEEQQIARVTLETIRKFERLPRSADLQKPEIQAEIVRAVAQAYIPVAQNALPGLASQPNIERLVAQTTELFIELSIDIPKIVVTPKGEVAYGYNDFDLDTSGISLQPVAMDILIQHLHSNEREMLASKSLAQETRLEDYIVRALIDYDDISYDDHADMLYKLAGQLTAHLRSYLPDEEALTNVLQYHQQRLAAAVHAQMQAQQWQGATDYAVNVTRGFTSLRSNSYSVGVGEGVRDFRAPVSERQNIRSMHFGGFRRCLYPVQKFDSDSERRFAVILEDASEVLKWFKPTRGQLQIYYTRDHLYEPDFVVETATAKLLCEPKRASEIEDEEVKAKARAAIAWCRQATEHELAHGGKSWHYLLIPHDAMLSNMTIGGLIATYNLS